MDTVVNVPIPTPIVIRLIRESLRKGSNALYFANCRAPSETWLPLLKKAYAKVHGDYQAIEGGFAGEGIEDLTGGVATYVRERRRPG